MGNASSKRKVIQLPGDFTIDRDDFIAMCKTLRSVGYGDDLVEETKKMAKTMEGDPSQRVSDLTLSCSQYNGTLPETIGNLTGLRKLVVRCSKIVTLPSSISRLQNLEYLDLSENEMLVDLPIEIGQLVNLRELNLSSLKIIDLPSSIGNLKNLQLLKLAETRMLVGLPDEILSLARLKTLQMSNSAIVSLPDCIGAPVAWSPFSIAQMHNLTSIDLSSTENLQELPSTFGNLTGLTEVNLKLSAIRSLPSSIGKLHNLSHLDLSKTQDLSELPESIGNLTCLTKINLNQSAIRLLPSSVGKLQNLRYLNLSETHALSKLPESIGNLSSLNELDLEGSCMESIPWIGGLKSLKNLDLCSMKNLTRLPDGISSLPCLKGLWLRSTKIESLPETIGQLDNLGSLSMGRCVNISKLPDDFCHLTSLTRLWMYDMTSLSELPRGFGCLSNLKHLALEGTGITSFSIPQGGLPSLRSLYIRNTSIPELQRNKDGFLWTLVQRHPLLSDVGYMPQQSRRLIYACDRNEARYRVRSCIPADGVQTLWPFVFRNVSSLFKNTAEKPDAIYQLLLDNAESIIVLLIDRHRNYVPRGAKRLKLDNIGE